MSELTIFHAGILKESSPPVQDSLAKSLQKFDLAKMVKRLDAFVQGLNHFDFHLIVDCAAVDDRIAALHTDGVA